MITHHIKVVNRLLFRVFFSNKKAAPEKPTGYPERLKILYQKALPLLPFQKLRKRVVSTSKASILTLRKILPVLERQRLFPIRVPQWFTIWRRMLVTLVMRRMRPPFLCYVDQSSVVLYASAFSDREIFSPKTCGAEIKPSA